MSYASAISTPKSVKAMFGLVRRSQVERAVREARVEGYREDVLNFGSDLQRFVDNVNASLAAKSPARPDEAAQRHAEQRPAPKA